MAGVDPGLADFLRAPARYVSAAGTGAGLWASQGVETEIISPLALTADANAEVARQATFLVGPLAKDIVVIPGLRRDLHGKCILVQHARLGYGSGGAPVFVLGVKEDERTKMSTLTVLKKI